MASKKSSGDMIAERYGSALYDLASEKKCIDNILSDFDLVEKVVKDNYGDIAAMLIEPCLGNIAGLEPSVGFLDHLRKLCDEYGIVLIFDEVKTGFRLANGGAREEYNVIPDISTYA